MWYESYFRSLFLVTVLSCYLGYPEWTRDTQYLFPEKFKKEVRTLMMMTLRDTNKQPRHPEAHFHLLPLELIDIIIRNLADDAGLSFPSSLLLHTTHAHALITHHTLHAHITLHHTLCTTYPHTHTHAGTHVNIFFAGNRKIYIQHSSGGMELVSLPHNVIPIDVACSYATYLCLTSK